MKNNERTNRRGYLWALIIGIGVMVVVFGLFQLASKWRWRSESAGDESRDSIRQTGLVQVADTEEPVAAPSAFLGVEVVPMDAVIAEQLGLPGKAGVLVNSVVSGSPAERAGLARGDVIVALNNRTVGAVEDVRNVMVALQPGDMVRVVYMRDGQKQMTYVRLTSSQPLQRTAGATEPDNAPWGATLSPLSDALRGRLGLPDQVQGVAVMSVQAGGPADEAGLAAGDVIQGVDGSPVEGMSDFFSALSSDSDETALLDVYGRGRMRYVPMDSSGLSAAADQTQDQAALRQRVFALFTGGPPFDSETDEQEEEKGGPEGGRFAEDDVELTADVTGFARPSTVPGDTNTGGPSGGATGFSRPSTVPGETNTGGPNAAPNDIVLFVGLLLLVILYLAYREFHRRPPEPEVK